jgi:hypothetical protein
MRKFEGTPPDPMNWVVSGQIFSPLIRSEIREQTTRRTLIVVPLINNRRARSDPY